MVAGNLQIGGTPFIYLVNAYADRWVVRREDRAYGIFAPLDPDPNLQEWPDMEELKAAPPRPMQEVSTRLRGLPDGRYLYDLYVHRALPWPAEGAPLTLPPGDGHLLAVYRAEVGETRLEAPAETSYGHAVSLVISILNTSGRPFSEPVPARLTVLDPDRQASVYSRSLLVKGGQLRVSVPLAENDALGRWILRVTNQATGQTVVHQLNVR